jgi:hypothetical protein
MSVKENQKSAETDKLKEIPKWTRRYAQNRTLTTFVLIVIIMLISMGIAVTSYLVAAAFMKGNMTVFWLGIAVLVAILMCLFIFSVSKFGGIKNKGWIDQRIDQWIYGKEGTASMPLPRLTKKKKWLDFVVGTLVGICILGTMFLAMEGYIAFKYMQPVSAIYFVPFLVFQYFLKRPSIGPLVLICPILYTIHAMLILAGVPMFFTGNLCMLNIFLPVFGYTFLAYVIGHVYSRYALKKLKQATHFEEGG